MSIFKRSNSPNFYVKYQLPSGEWVEKSTGTPVRRRALREAERIELEALKGATEGVPLPRATQEFLEEMRRVGRHPQHVHGFKGVLKAFGESVQASTQPWADLPTVRAFLNSLSGKSPGTRIYSQSALSAFFTFCVQSGYLPATPSRASVGPAT